MSAPLSRVLLFCLFSLLFGVLAALIREGFRALFTSFRLLPSSPPPPAPFSARFSLKREKKREEEPKKTKSRKQKSKKAEPPKEKKKEKKKGKGFSPKHLGFLLYDISTPPLLGALYLVFLYEANDGVFRLYSLLLALGGFFLSKGVLARVFFRPLLCLLSFFFSLFGALLRLPLWIFLVIFRRASRKKPKKLDERAKMV